MDYRLEVAQVPVSDVDTTKAFYQGLGWRLEADVSLGSGARFVQLTPPGSACSVTFGKGIAPGLELVVNDIDDARTELTTHGVEVSDVFHRDGAMQVPGPAPDHQSYNSYASFKDPDGNNFLLQEVTTRRPGRTTTPLAAYGTVDALAGALRRAAEAHDRHEQETGHADEDWPAWYAQFMADDTYDPNAGK